jgi:hypothetical protein
MADVVIVSAREDGVLADAIGASFARSGLSVVKDDGRNSQTAPCVLVLWTPHSVDDEAVRAQAAHARGADRLVSVKFGGVEPATGFNRPAPFDLDAWEGDPEDPLLDRVFFAVDRIATATRLRARRGAPPVDVSPEELLAPEPAPPPPNLPSEREIAAQTAAWKKIQHSANVADFEAFLRTYGPTCLFHELAELHIERLRTAPDVVELPRILPIERADPSAPGLRRAGPVDASQPAPSRDSVTSWTAPLPAWREPPVEQLQQRREATEYLSATARAQMQRERAAPPPNRPRRSIPLDEDRFTDEHARAPRPAILPWRYVFLAVLIGAGGYVLVVGPKLGGKTEVRTDPLSGAVRAGPLQEARTEEAPPESTEAAPASAAPAVNEAEYVNPIWLAQPSQAQVAKFYPADLKARGVTGQGALDCLIEPDGALACKVIEATPESAFGDAALSAAKTYRADLGAAGKHVRLTIGFGVDYP